MLHLVSPSSRVWERDDHVGFSCFSHPTCMLDSLGYWWWKHVANNRGLRSRFKIASGATQDGPSRSLLWATVNVAGGEDSAHVSFIIRTNHPVLDGSPIKQKLAWICDVAGALVHWVSVMKEISNSCVNT